MTNRLTSWWGSLNGVKRALAALVVVIVVGFGAGAFASEYRGLPARVTANEQAIEAIQTGQVEINNKLDRATEDRSRMLCILQLEEDESALSCEGE